MKTGLSVGSLHCLLTHRSIAIHSNPMVFPCWQGRHWPELQVPTWHFFLFKKKRIFKDILMKKDLKIKCCMSFLFLQNEQKY